MAKSLSEILSAENLCGLVNDPRGGVPADILPPGFLAVGRRIKGQSGTYFKMKGSRDTTPLTEYGAPSSRVALKDVSAIPFNCLHFHSHEIHTAATLNQLRSTDGATQRLGEQQLEYQVREFRRRLNNNRVSAVYSALKHGAIYYDGDGDLLPSSTNAVTTVDYGMSANNKNQLNGIIGASWATAGTDIIGDLTAIRETARKTTGIPLKYAFYGANIVGYLLGNTAIQKMIEGNPALSASFGQNVIPPGFMQFTWLPAYEAFYEDADGTNQDWWGGDDVVFTPEPSADWWQIIEGTYPVPLRLGGVSADAGAAAADVADVPGMFSYAKILDDPVSIKHNMGDTFFPAFMVPDAVYTADVTP